MAGGKTTFFHLKSAPLRAQNVANALAASLVTTMHHLIAQERQWPAQVRFNWFREFGKNLVMLTHPKETGEFIKLTEQECRMPQGILAIYRLLNQESMPASQKIEHIKEVLAAKGYDGVHQDKSWKRTGITHGIYCRLADAITVYERQLPLKNDASPCTISCP